MVVNSDNKNNKIVYGVVGAGWRAEFFLRIAREMPERFEVCGLVTRDEEKGRGIENTWGIKTYKCIDDLLKAENPGFVVVSVAKEAAPSIIAELAGAGVPVLAETPPAPDLEQLIKLNKLVKGAKIQVAEQYHLQPLHFARIAIANSGKLGEISQVQVSFSHGYHAVSIARKLLRVGFENASINAFEYASPIVAGPGRKGPPEQEKIVSVNREIALLDFGGKLVVYDFTKDQHRSWVRSIRVEARGDRGEISNSEVRYLKDFKTPIEYELKRKNAGEDSNLEGYHLKGILAGEEWIYVNPFIPAKLSDDEIAVASCLEKMNTYVKGGPDFYSLAEASQDHYLGLMVRKAIETKGPVLTKTQPWAEE